MPSHPSFDELPSGPDRGALLEASPNAYVVLNRELTIVDANEAYLQATGRDRETILGQNMFEAFPGDPEGANARKLRASFERVLSTGEPDSLALIPYAIPKETAEGTKVEKRYWSATHTPLFDEDGEVAFILQHTTDVTELYEKGFYNEGDGEGGLSEEEVSEENISGEDISEEDTPEESLQGEEAQRGVAQEEVAQEELAQGTFSGEGLAHTTPQQAQEGVFSRAEEVQQAYWASEEERARLRRLFKQAPGFMVFQRGPEHVYELANDAYLDLIGRRDIIGKPAREVLPELEGQGFFDLLDQVYETGEPYVGREVEARVQREPGEGVKTVYVDFIYQPIIGPEGETLGIFTQGHDVTEKKKVKDRLRQRKAELEELNETLEKRAQEARREQERLRSLLDSIPDEVWFCNEDGQISLVNEAVVEEFGFESLEDARRPLKEILVELDVYDPDETPRPVKESPLFRSLEGEVVEGEEELLFCPEAGEKRYRQINSAPLRDQSGEITGSVAVVRDITDLKRTEKKLRQRERDFTALANNIPQLAWMAEPDGYIYWFNERWHEFAGTTPEEMEGWGWKKVHHPDHLDRAVKKWTEAIETGEPFEAIFPLGRRDGEYRWFLTRAMPIRDEEGRVVRWFGTNTDITKRLRLEEELKELNETLEERVEKRTRQVRKLASQVTRAEQRERERIGRLLHDDLQQKLYGSQLQLSALQDSLGQSGQDDLAFEVGDAVGQIEEIIQSLRRLSIGMSPPVLESEGLAAALEWLRSHMEEMRGLTVELVAEEEFYVGEEMRVLLFQVVRELLSNVAEHAGVGQATAELKKEEGEEEERTLLLRVSDQGEGFNPEKLEDLSPEEGFGLTAARERIRLFGGDLEVRSTPGEGTQVTVRVPLDRQAEWNSG